MTLEDNEPCIKAVRKGYSNNLRYLPRVQRTSIGFLHDLFETPPPDSWGECKPLHHEGASHKGDLFTKEIHCAMTYNDHISRIGMVGWSSCVVCVASVGIGVIRRSRGERFILHPFALLVQVRTPSTPVLDSASAPHYVRRNPNNPPSKPMCGGPMGHGYSSSPPPVPGPHK